MTARARPRSPHERAARTAVVNLRAQRERLRREDALEMDRRIDGRSRLDHERGKRERGRRRRRLRHRRDERRDERGRSLGDGARELQVGRVRGRERGGEEHRVSALRVAHRDPARRELRRDLPCRAYHVDMSCASAAPTRYGGRPASLDPRSPSARPRSRAPPLRRAPLRPGRGSRAPVHRTVQGRRARRRVAGRAVRPTDHGPAARGRRPLRDRDRPGHGAVGAARRRRMVEHQRVRRRAGQRGAGRQRPRPDHVAVCAGGQRAGRR